MISGFAEDTYLGKSSLVNTDLIPFTFQEEINSLSGVFPVPYDHLLTLEFSYLIIPWSEVLNFLDLLFTGAF
jgi:hypothetical protein